MPEAERSFGFGLNPYQTFSSLSTGQAHVTLPPATGTNVTVSTGLGASPQPLDAASSAVEEWTNSCDPYFSRRPQDRPLHIEPTQQDNKCRRY